MKTAILLTFLGLSTHFAGVLSDADKLFDDDNFSEAYDLYQTLVETAETSGVDAARALDRGTRCLAKLDRFDEADAFIDSALASHGSSWRVAERAAFQFVHLDHDGRLVA
ncbi:MAG: hypothetical protein AAF585_11455, partial [Verrucomicrobiota bacterium]